VGAPVRLRDIAEVVDSVEDNAILAFKRETRGAAGIFRQPAANMIETVDRIMPFFHNSVLRFAFAAPEHRG